MEDEALDLLPIVEEPDSTLGELPESQDQPPLKKSRTGFSCDVCKTSYSEKRSLVRHFQTTVHCEKAGLPAPAYRCGFCKQPFSRRDICQRHENEVHFHIKRGFRRSQPQDTNVTRAVDPATSKPPEDGAESAFDRSIDAAVGPLNNDTTSISNPDGISQLQPTIRATNVLPEQVDECWDESPTSPGFDHSTLVDSGSDRGQKDIPAIDTFGTDTKDPFDDKAEQLDEDHDALVTEGASIRSVSTFRSIRSAFRSSTRFPRSYLIRRGAYPRLRGYKLPVRCCFCQQFLGSSVTEIREHLEQHSATIKTTLSCDICQLNFTQEQDLKLHMTSAAQGHCGFDFDHIEQCQGHHPPDIYSEMLTDNDRLQFSLRREHWEQAQLRDYLHQVSDLVDGHSIPLDLDCWSMGALRTSLGSISSLLSHAMQYSAPDGSDYQGRLDNSKLPLLARLKSKAVKGLELSNSRLVSAAMEGDEEKIHSLVLAGFDVNATQRMWVTLPGVRERKIYFHTPLEAAIAGGKVESVKLLIQLGAAVGRVNTRSFCQMPLTYAALLGNKKIVKVLLEHGADANYKIYNCELTALSCAVNSGILRIVQLMLKHGADVNQRAGKYGTALIDAVALNRKDIAQLLLDHGADVNARPERLTACQFAAARGDEEMLRLLLRSGANGEARSMIDSALQLAVYNYDTEMAHFLSTQGDDEEELPVYRYREGTTRVHHE